MSETLLPEHSGGRELDDGIGLPRGVRPVYERCLSTGVVERHRMESTCYGGWVIPKNSPRMVDFTSSPFTFFSMIFSDSAVVFYDPTSFLHQQENGSFLPDKRFK